MEKGINGFDTFIKKIEGVADGIVGKIYVRDAVTKIEKLDFMKKLVNSGFISGIQNFGEGWFKQVFVFLGYLSMIGGAIGSIMGLYDIVRYIGYTTWMLSSIIRVMISLFSIIVGVGMVKFKKWYPFAVLIQAVLCIASIIMSYIIFLSIPYAEFLGQGGISTMFINLGLFSIIFTIIFALILKNKALFGGDVIEKKEETNETIETDKEL